MDPFLKNVRATFDIQFQGSWTSVLPNSEKLGKAETMDTVVQKMNLGTRSDVISNSDSCYWLCDFGLVVPTQFPVCRMEITTVLSAWVIIR